MKTQANKCFLSFVNPRFYTDSQDHFSIGHESRGDGEWRKLCGVDMVRVCDILEVVWWNLALCIVNICKKNLRKEIWETSYRWAMNKNYILTGCHFSGLTNEKVKPAWQHHFSNGTEHKACKLEQSWKNLTFAALAAAVSVEWGS